MLVPSRNSCSSQNMFERRVAAAWASGSGAAACSVEGATSGKGSNWGLERASVNRGKTRPPHRIVEPRRAERGGGEEKSWAFRGDDGATDAVNPLWAARW